MLLQEASSSVGGDNGGQAGSGDVSSTQTSSSGSGSGGSAGGRSGSGSIQTENTIPDLIFRREYGIIKKKAGE